MRIAMLGTRGVPAAYGGFETAVEEIGSRLAARGHEVTVFEAADQPGGQIRLTAQSERRREMISIIAWRQAMCEKHGVTFNFNTKTLSVSVKLDLVEGEVFSLVLNVSAVSVDVIIGGDA